MSLRGLACALLLSACTAPALADEPAIDLAAAVTVDVAGVVAGDGDRTLRALSNVDLTADLNLDRLIGWDGARAHVYLIDNHGKRPNDAAGTLEGVNNIEVPDAGTRLFEAWVEKDLAAGTSLRVGLYDLNSEFYANDAAGLLIAPPFGIGSELAATGPNGPSIFPSSALAARLRVAMGGDSGYAQVALLNAHASTVGDATGIDFGFHDGLLLIGETGVTKGRVRGSVGAWVYSRKRESLFETNAAGDPLRQSSQGVYAVIEADLLNSEGEGRQLTAFLRAGISDPHATPFTGGFQTGLLLSPAIAGRDASALSIGVHHAWTSSHYRDMLVADGRDPSSGESAVELTYSDNLTDFLALQPDVQWIRHPGGDRAARDAVVLTLRTTVSF